MQELTLFEFIVKLCVAIVPFLIAYVWIFTRCLFRADFVFSGIALEKRAVQEGQISIDKLQENTWSVNSSQVQNFAAITVAIVLLVVVFVIEKNLNFWSESYLNLIILVIGFSCMANTFSLQFWNCVIDKGPDVQWLLSRRRIATILQVIGWNGLYLSVIICVSYADTFCGLILSLVGAVGLAITMELKIPHPKDTKAVKQNNNFLD